MTSFLNISIFVVISILPIVLGNELDSFTDSLLREVLSRMGGPEDSLAGPISDFDVDPNPPHEEQPSLSDYPGKAFEARRDAILNREPSIRDEEYLEHSSLFGTKYVQGGAGEGHQRLRPDGSMKNMQIVKTDGVLPAFCNPPDPCPLGYTSADGCLENFVNSASFSRQYQAAQQCMCDSEHMFDCPGSTRENEIDALARTFENEGLAEVALDRLIKTMEIEGEHKNLVAKKFFSHKPLNPYLEGEKLPVVAKKAPKSSIK